MSSSDTASVLGALDAYDEKFARAEKSANCFIDAVEARFKSAGFTRKQSAAGWGAIISAMHDGHTKAANEGLNFLETIQPMLDTAKGYARDYFGGREGLGKALGAGGLAGLGGLAYTALAGPDRRGRRNWLRNALVPFFAGTAGYPLIGKYNDYLADSMDQDSTPDADQASL